jgi:exosortase A
VSGPTITTQTIAPPAPASGAARDALGHRPALAAILIGLACLGVVFRPEIAAATRVWSESTAYNHCYLIIPIALYLAWERRHRLAGLPVVPLPRLALLALPLGLAWLVAERVGVMEGRQLVALTLVELLFVAVLGWRMSRALAAPLLYLYFLVPFGAFLTPVLQDFTARFTVIGLNLIGIPNFSDGYTIEIPAGTFYVAEACAGLRFLIASIAFGALYACLIYRSTRKRLIFLGVSIVVPIIANGFRALGIVVLGDMLGSAEAAAADHIIYGWIFFSVVILLLTACGLPFREDTRPDPVPAPAPSGAAPVGWGAALGAAFAVVLLALAGPVAAHQLDASGAAQAMRPLPDTLAGLGCTAAPDPGVAAGDEAAAHGPGAMRRYLCDDGRIALRMVRLPPRSSPSVLVEQQRRLIGPVGGGEVDQHWLHVAHGAARDWLLLEAEESNDAVASAVWIDGRPAHVGLTDRIRQARNSLVGSPYAPVIVAISLESDPATQRRRGARQQIQSFLDSRPDLGDVIDELTR